MISVSQLMKDALSLPPEDRIRLAEQLWESVHAAPESLPVQSEAELIEELNRRNAELDEGRVREVPYEEVMARLRSPEK